MSRAASGSSSKSKCGRDKIARASATRWASPPESLVTGRGKRWAISRTSSTCSMLRSVRSAVVSAALGAEENVFPHGKVWKQRAFLRDVADASLLRWQIDSPRGGEEHFAADLDLAVGDVAQAGDGVEQRGLAGARRPEDRRDARIERDVDIQFETCQRYAAAQQHVTFSFPCAAATPNTRRTEMPRRR